MLKWIVWYVLGSVGLGLCIAAGVLARDAWKQSQGARRSQGTREESLPGAMPDPERAAR